MLKVKKGCTYDYIVQVIRLNEETTMSSPVDLRDYDSAIAILYQNEGENPLDEFECEIVPAGATNPENNLINISLSSEITDKEIGDYYLDVFIVKDSDPIVKKPILTEIIAVRY